MPHRRCTGCGAVRPQEDLLRLALREPGVVVADPARRLPGRGAYVCDAACLEQAVRRRGLHRAFRRPVEIPSDVLESSTSG